MCVVPLLLLLFLLVLLFLSLAFFARLKGTSGRGMPRADNKDVDGFLTRILRDCLGGNGEFLIFSSSSSSSASSSSASSASASSLLPAMIHGGDNGRH